MAFRLKTNADGRFTQHLPVGNYVVEVAYVDALKAATKSKPEVAGAKGKVTVSEIVITLMYDCCPGDLNGDGRADVRMHKPFTVTKELSGPSLTITKVGGGVLSGQLRVGESATTWRAVPGDRSRTFNHSAIRAAIAGRPRRRGLRKGLKEP